jgi:hypothetical protein
MLIIVVGIAIMIWQSVKRPAFFRGETLARTPRQHPSPEGGRTLITETALLEKVPRGLFIGGEWVDGSAARSPSRPRDRRHPRRDRRRVAEDGIRALDAAVAAQDAWAATPARAQRHPAAAFDLLPSAPTSSRCS